MYIIRSKSKRYTVHVDTVKNCLWRSCCSVLYILNYRRTSIHVVLIYFLNYFSSGLNYFLNLYCPLHVFLLSVSLYIRGGDLVGRSPQNLRWGAAHASVPPIFWETVLSDARESTNIVKKGVIKGILFWNSGFSCEERVIHDIRHSTGTENLGKGRENPKNLVDD